MSLLGFGSVLGSFNVVKASTGQLTVNLDQWQYVVFERKGKRCAIGVDEVFQALSDASLAGPRSKTVLP
jgi:hypothetical protein